MADVTSADGRSFKLVNGGGQLLTKLLSRCDVHCLSSNRPCKLDTLSQKLRSHVCFARTLAHAIQRPR